MILLVTLTTDEVARLEEVLGGEWVCCQEQPLRSLSWAGHLPAYPGAPGSVWATYAAFGERKENKSWKSFPY